MVLSSCPSILTTFLLLIAVCLSWASAIPIETADQKEHEKVENEIEAPEWKHPGQIWAVLIAGSNGWWNYRHQADVCHAYHVLINHGIKPDNIITMMYDDIANDTEDNPYPGKIFNQPDGPDVYQGVRIDYTGDDVNRQNFLNVLLGNDTATGGKKVLKSTYNDKVFVYYSDHGGTGVIGMPTWPYVTVQDLSETLKQMHVKGLYKELTFYLEACESGSMFDWKMAEQLNVYAVTAANGDESSWATYCETDLLPDNCLGDEFSVAWLEDSDNENLRRETLAKQFGIVRNNTKSSHVQEFGTLHIQHEYVSEFQGKKRGRHHPQGPSMVQGMKKPEKYLNFHNNIMPEMCNAVNVLLGGCNLQLLSSPVHQGHSVKSRDVPLFMMAHKHRALGGATGNEVVTVLEKRAYLERQMGLLVDMVLAENSLTTNAAERQKLLGQRPGRVNNMPCHHRLVNAFNDKCFPLDKNPYAMEHIFVLANLCDLQPAVATERIEAAMGKHCAKLEIRQGIL